VGGDMHMGSSKAVGVSPPPISKVNRKQVQLARHCRLASK